jgi:hypothetical protein
MGQSGEASLDLHQAGDRAVVGNGGHDAENNRCAANGAEAKVGTANPLTGLGDDKPSERTTLTFGQISAFGNHNCQQDREGDPILGIFLPHL